MQIYFQKIFIYNVTNHNKHIFVKPKKMCLFWEICLFWGNVLILGSGGFRIGIVYALYRLRAKGQKGCSYYAKCAYLECDYYEWVE